MHRPYVLLVDDEEFIREPLRETLFEEGFTVVEAASGGEVLALLNARHPINALITDIVLGPGPDGWSVARAVRDVHPSCPVIYMSGYVPGELDKVPGGVFLRKPLRPSALCATLADLIRAGALGGPVLGGLNPPGH